jgi:hypothetical protein
MALAEPSGAWNDAPRCAHCGAVIGVYEPATRVVGSVAFTTSRAADPSLTTSSTGQLYHAPCHALARRGTDT